MTPSTRLARVMLCGFFSLLFLIISTSDPAFAKIYVKADAAGLDDGTSWADAYADLQDALATASNGDTIWVAAGTYMPTGGTDRTATFQLASGVLLFGGFAGLEILLAERDLQLNPTVLSGEIGTTAAADNSYHVTTGSGVDPTAVLDGFVITGGYADGSSLDGAGGGMLNISGHPTIVNVTFTDNYANTGGGMFNNGSHPLLVNVAFNYNSAGSGGAMTNFSGSDAVLNNVNIIANTASNSGGGLFNSTSDLSVMNSIIWGNEAMVGPQVSNSGSLPVFSYSLIQDSWVPSSWNPDLGIDGGNNLAVDPEFADESGGNFRLEQESPAIDAGSNAAPGIAPTDLDGNTRIVGGTIDMGVYEFACFSGPVIYVDIDATGAHDGTSWSDAFTALYEACAVACGGNIEIWVAEGTYHPTLRDDRDSFFRMRSGVDIYGGFDGTETTREERDYAANLTVLSGEIGTPAHEDNCFSVVYGWTVDETGILDGFTVTRGYADPGTGGGISLYYSDAILRNLIVIDNYGRMGGGIVSWGTSYLAPTPEITNVLIQDNTGGIRGGGMHAAFSNPRFTDVVFENNQVLNGSGGGLYNWDANPLLTNVQFIGNTAEAAGGVMNNTESYPVFINAVFIGNEAARGGAIGVYSSSRVQLTTSTLYDNTASGSGGGIYNSDGIVEAWNTILWGNTALDGPQVYNLIGTSEFEYSLIEGCGGSGVGWDPLVGIDNGNNIDADPRFVNSAGGNVRLAAGSPAIDTGNSGAPFTPPVDFDGNPRIVGVAVDMGAFEHDGVTAIGDPDTPSPESSIALHAVYPNPFNPTVTVSFELDRGRDVRVTIYDVRGGRVREVFEGQRTAGLHKITWNAEDDSGNRVASGMYFLEVQSEGWKDIRKIMLLK